MTWELSFNQVDPGDQEHELLAALWNRTAAMGDQSLLVNPWFSNTTITSTSYTSVWSLDIRLGNIGESGVKIGYRFMAGPVTSTPTLDARLTIGSDNNTSTGNTINADGDEVFVSVTTTSDQRNTLVAMELEVKVGTSGDQVLISPLTNGLCFHADTSRAS